MSAVDQAADWAGEIVNREARGPGDLDNAMRRVSSRWGVPYSILWRLRYRPPKDIVASAYLRLQQAYHAERERQLRRLLHDIEITAAIAGAAAPSVVAAKALVGAEQDAP